MLNSIILLRKLMKEKLEDLGEKNLIIKVALKLLKVGLRVPLR